MFSKLLILLVATLSSINGQPLDTVEPYDPRSFLSSRIVGGVDAPEGYGKHMAALVFSQGWLFFLCGGSLISKRHVLTAAHCIEPMLTWDLELTLSFHGKIGTKIWSTGTNDIRFTGYVMHADWDLSTIKNDIGLLSVAEDIRESESVAIITLNFDRIGGGEEAYVCGWGLLGSGSHLPEKLQVLYKYIISHTECERRIREATETLGPAPPVVARIEICTLHSPGHGMCNGDSGSAVVHKATQTQVGIVSWAFPCAHGVPDVSVRISGFRHWILSHTQGLIANAKVEE